MGEARLVIATELGSPGDGVATAAALAVSIASRGERTGGPGVPFVEVGGSVRRRPTLLSSAAARALEERVAAIGELRPAARGRICWVGLEAGEAWRVQLAAVIAASGGLAVAHLEPMEWRQALDDPELAPAAALVRADVAPHRDLLALLAAELRDRRLPLRVATRPLGLVGARRALAGLEPGGPAGPRAARVARALVPPVAASERGQALPLVAGLCLVVLVVALALTALSGAVNVTARDQRAADLLALSAARSMRDDTPRLLAPARLPDGSVNPAHIGRGEYLARARAAAQEAADRNGVARSTVEVAFPDAGSALPVRARVEIDAQPDRWAIAQASPPQQDPVPATTATGDYSGPLAERQGKPMRPDVAEAFDRLGAAAARDGISLIISSAYRSDADQARLFAANPDPRWVAPPGTSLHRCGTELDLAPAAAYGWLAANAPRFGFLKRYSWEPWHFGFDRGPAPCSAASSSAFAGGRGGDGSAPRAVPDFVPARYRPPIMAASARWGVSAALLGAQLMAESGFDPTAVSLAGARGIAQFMPGTAAAYGLRDPFDPGAAIDAQAHLMSDLLAQFGDTALALAAYNAGPAPVEACGCVPPYPETQAYVARILALTGGAGEVVPQLEVRLVA